MVTNPPCSPLVTQVIQTVVQALRLNKATCATSIQFIHDATRQEISPQIKHFHFIEKEIIIGKKANPIQRLVMSVLPLQWTAIASAILSGMGVDQGSDVFCEPQSRPVPPTLPPAYRFFHRSFANTALHRSRRVPNQI